MNREERDVLALLLEGNAAIAVGALRRDGGGFSPLAALGAARSLEQILGDTLHALAEEARASGHTWQEIADIASTSRQAAFARFGRARNGKPSLRREPAKAAKRAQEVFDAFLAADWSSMHATFDKRVGSRITTNELDAVRNGVRNNWGEVIDSDAPLVRIGLGVTVADIGVHFKEGNARFRIVFDSNLLVSAFFLLPAVT